MLLSASMPRKRCLVSFRDLQFMVFINVECISGYICRNADIDIDHPGFLSAPRIGCLRVSDPNSVQSLWASRKTPAGPVMMHCYCDCKCYQPSFKTHQSAGSLPWEGSVARPTASPDSPCQLPRILDGLASPPPPFYTSTAYTTAPWFFRRDIAGYLGSLRCFWSPSRPWIFDHPWSQ